MTVGHRILPTAMGLFPLLISSTESCTEMGNMYHQNQIWLAVYPCQDFYCQHRSARGNRYCRIVTGIQFVIL